MNLYERAEQRKKLIDRLLDLSQDAADLMLTLDIINEQIRVLVDEIEALEQEPFE